ncbi:hypothetical protein [Dictyobacter kobayashii]|uniref:Potassium channel domain-containing protein n=1 Tax=Dictyobacter kobayashii TaxID=2014872 RepID=A0A402ABP8_9CHLR|nr:hypothetical protein [Dictyobacter kobayashii]GCE16516.1 hypothetical protein KDK_03160 [Dictyobacter kobayashii]
MLILIFLLRVVVFGLGFFIVGATFLSALRTFVLPRSATDIFSRTVFIWMRYLVEIRMRGLSTFRQRDRAMELYAPLSLLALLVVWLVCIQLGYMCMIWAVDGALWYDAFKISGSSLLTLGFSVVDNFPSTLLVFSEAIIGLVLIALLIAYLPTIYSAFERRESAVTMLEVRAGSPPSAVEMIIRYSRLKRLDQLGEIWTAWEVWFVDIEESHTSLAALSFLRSPQPHRSWVTAAGAVLDAASLVLSSVDIPRDSQADLCIRAGYLSLRYICELFRIPYHPNPDATDPISISRSEFEVALDQMVAAGVPVLQDREQAWKDYRGWRVNYDTVLLALAELTMAPTAPWSSDRLLKNAPPVVLRWRKGAKPVETHEWLPPSDL